MVNSYNAHVGRTVERARKCGSICTLPIDYLTSLKESTNKIPSSFTYLPRLNHGADVVVYDYDYDINEIEHLKNEILQISTEDSVPEKKVTESFLFSCEYATNHKMHLYFFIDE